MKADGSDDFYPSAEVLDQLCEWKRGWWEWQMEKRKDRGMKERDQMRESLKDIRIYHAYNVAHIMLPASYGYVPFTFFLFPFDYW